MFKRVGFFVIVASFFFIFITVVRAETTGTVTATVTAQNISVSVDNGDGVDFGTIGVGSTANTTTAGVNDSTTATNNGNVIEDFSVKADDSTNWNLAATAGSEDYTMQYCVTTCDSSPVWADVGISPSYVEFDDTVSVSGTSVFDLQVGTPTSTTEYGEQTITVTVLATLHS
jgi:hypothetical protein